jgi:hypothetical protein
MKDQNRGAANEHDHGQSEQFTAIIHRRQSNSKLGQVAKDRSADHTE